jgi:hypothetical protein
VGLVAAIAHRRCLGGALTVTALAAAVPASGHRTAHTSAYCSSIPRVEVQRQEWGFHAGQPQPGPGTSYARGHGKIDLAASTASGVICQVDRSRAAGERQIVLSIDHRVAYASHHAVMFGVPGNIVRIRVHVRSTTDASCATGTRGEVTIFASYNGVHEDSVQFSFPAGCRGHVRRYTGSGVVTNVPPN